MIHIINSSLLAKENIFRVAAHLVDSGGFPFPAPPPRYPSKLVAWQHINLYGRYEFNKRPKAINMKEIIQELSQALSGQHLVV